jgi:hypothetical protein
MIGAVVRSMSSTSPMLICFVIVAIVFFLHVCWIVDGVIPS